MSTRIPSNSSQHSSQHSSLRNQIYNIVPKHALFIVRVQIHQLSNVPFLGGQFGVKWRFRNVQSVGPHASLLTKMKAGNKSAVDATGGGTLKGKGREVNLDEDYHPQAQGHASTPGIYVNGLLNGTDSSDYITAGGRHNPKSSTSSSTDSSPLNTTSTHDHVYSDGRGITDWAPLQDHTAKWEHSVNVVVRMDVDRETSDLLSNELKLTVMQRVIPGDPDSPDEPRRGIVHLNLAEYADAGSVTRRYLLRQSKTNATLKVTIELEHVGGEPLYRAPPLQKGEILAQVSGLLSNPGFHRAKFLRELEKIENPDMDPQDVFNPTRMGSSFNGLASSQSVRATEYLIETIFNPIPASTASASPFTREIPLPSDEASSFDSSLNEQRSTDSNHTGPSAPSLASANSGDSMTGLDKPKPAWWRKVGSSRALMRTPPPPSSIAV